MAASGWKKDVVTESLEFGASADGGGGVALLAGSQAGAGDDERICAGVVVYRTHADHCEYINIALWWDGEWWQLDVR